MADTLKLSPTLWPNVPATSTVPSGPSAIVPVTCRLSPLWLIVNWTLAVIETNPPGPMLTSPNIWRLNPTGIGVAIVTRLPAPSRWKPPKKQVVVFVPSGVHDAPDAVTPLTANVSIVCTVLNVLSCTRKSPLSATPGMPLELSVRNTSPTTPLLAALFGSMNTVRLSWPVSEPRSAIDVPTARVIDSSPPVAPAATSIWMKPVRVITPPIVIWALMFAATYTWPPAGAFGVGAPFGPGGEG